MNSKVAIVTGASRGIGAATAKLLTREGFRVVVNYCERRDAAQAVVEELATLGGDALAVQADIAIEDEVVRMFDTIDEQCGRVDVLVNNAGILHQQSRVQNLTVERLHQVMTVNVIGAFLCCRETLKRMKTGGAIVNVSSVASRLGAPNEYVDYAASKGAIDSLTIGLAKEVADRGVRVNAVRPGFIDTDIHASGGEPGRVARVGPGLPLGRGGSANEVAEAILWLASDKSSFTTGEFIDVAGGK